MKRIASAFLVFCGIFLVQSASEPAGRIQYSVPDPLVFIILPAENVSRMYEEFLPLKDYLEEKLSRKVVIRIAKDYQETIESIGTGRAHLAYLDPSTYCEAHNRYRVVPLARIVSHGSATYKSVLVTRDDSPIRKIVDARGKRLALGNTSSSSSYLIPAVMFKEVGITFGQFSSVDYLEHEDRIALSVLSGRHDIGGISEHVASKYIKDGLRIIKVSEAIPQYAICAWPGLPKHLRNKIKSALLSFRNGEDLPGEDMNGFTDAEDRDFDVVRIMIKNLTGRNYIEYSRNSVKVAILPLYSAITLFDRFDPLMKYLSRKTGCEFKLVIPRDFEDFSDLVKKGKVDFTYSNPYIYIQLADKGYLRALANTIIPDTGDIFRGIIITRRDSPIRSLSDLRGKRVMIVSFKSAGGFLAQKLMLSKHGIDVYKDLNLIDGKRQERVILNVYRKKADAGFVRESALDVLRDEIDLGMIRVLARTPYITNWPFSSAKKTPSGISSLTQKALVELKDTKILSAAHVISFRLADDHDFDSLRKRINTNGDK